MLWAEQVRLCLDGDAVVGNKMNLFELLFFLLACFVSFLFGRYFFRYVGWWGVLPAVILGFGIVIGLPVVLRKFFGRRRELPGKTNKKKSDGAE